LRLREGLERAGVLLAEDALAPKVGGDLRGTVLVRKMTVRSTGLSTRPSRAGSTQESSRAAADDTAAARLW